MSEARRILHVVRRDPPPEGLEVGGGDTLFLLGEVRDGEDLGREAEILLNLVFEHDVVVTW